jgi:sec-independent protein translocase protein TatC
MALFKKKNAVQKEGDEAEMSFLDHLEVLRWHLIRAISAILIGAIVIFLAKDFVFEQIIFAPKKASFPTYKILCSLGDALCMQPPKLELITRELGEQFMIHLKSSFILGFVVAFPYVIYEIWRFIKPGLYKNERKYARGFVSICSLLFLIGVLFGYFVISPFAITFLGSYSVGSEAVNSPTLASYVNYMTMFTLPSGIVFELPVIVYFLTKIGIVSSSAMKKYRRHAIVVILVLSAIITPPDVVTQFLIGVPILFLYEISILISRRLEKKTEKALKNA